MNGVPEELPEIREALDPVFATRRKHARAYFLNVFEIPAMRLTGFFLVALCVALHNRFLLHEFSWPAQLRFTFFALAYCLASWLVLRLFYKRAERVNLGELFLLMDLLVWTTAIYASGGERSALFFILIFRVADQTYISLRRVLVLAHVSVACYALLLLYLSQVEHRVLSWPAEGTKLLLLYASNIYIALTAKTAEGLRKKLTSAIHVARGLILQLEEKTSQLAEAKTIAETASLAKSTFLANMSHELRTPLNAVIGYSEMLQDEVRDRGQGDLVPDLARIHAAGLHLLDLINQVLDLSKIEAGKMELYLEEIAVDDLLQNVIATVQPLLDKNENGLEIALSPALGTIVADVTKLRQVLLNLLSNAAKFTKGGTVRLEASRELKDGSDRITFRVVDNGIGMSEPEVQRLFQAFTQADSSTSRRYGGTGLGLTISQRFCELMAGDIRVASEPGKGSAFTVRLPAFVGETPPAVGSTLPHIGRTEPLLVFPPLPGRRAQPTGKHVLVIDDDPTARDLVTEILRRDGFSVSAARGGEEGLRLAHERIPDMITLDVMMPGVDGWTVLSQLKADPAIAHIPVVMLTVVDERTKGFNLGAAGYVIKPIEREQLTSILKRLP